MIRSYLIRRGRPVALGVVSVLALAACGVGGSGGEDPAPGADVGEGGELSGDITFQTWNLKAGFEDYFTGLIEDFTTEHPGVSIEWLDQPADGYADKLQADAANGNLPDVVNVDPALAYPLAQAGVLMDLSEAAPEAEDEYLPNAWADYSYPGMEGTYAFPWYLSTGPVFYNKALFEQAGLDPEAPPTTFDELYEQALEMGEAADGQYFMLGSIPELYTFGEYGIPLMNDDGTEFVFNTPEAVEIVEAYADMYAQGGLLPEATVATYSDRIERFMSEQIALTAGSAYDLENFKTNAPGVYSDIGITPVVTANGGEPNMASQGIAVSANSESPEAAVAFARFVTNEENQLAFAKLVNIFPSTAGTLEDPYFTEDDGTDTGALRVAAAEQLETAVNHSPPQWTEEMRVTLQRELSDALAGRQSAQEALDAAVDEANRILGAR